MKKRKTPKKTAKKASKSSPGKRLRLSKKPLKKISRKSFKSKKLEIKAPAPIPQPAEFRPQPVPQAPAGFELPSRYGDNRLVLLVRDPWWIFAYWEVTPELEREVLERVRRQGSFPEKTVLRVHDVTDAVLENPHPFFDIEIGQANNWYVDVGQPDRQWQAQIGIRTPEGKFFALVTSNVVRTPRYGASNVLDEEWLLPDDLYWKLFGASSGFGKSVSSLNAQQILERYLKSIVSSPGGPAAKAKSAAATQNKP